MNKIQAAEQKYWNAQLDVWCNNDAQKASRGLNALHLKTITPILTFQSLVLIKMTF